MDRADETSWTLVAQAAAGHVESREAFARIYGPVIRAYLTARWKLARDHDEVLNAMSEVFLQCFKPDGALGRAEARRAGGFRAYLYGITRHVANALSAAKAGADGGSQCDLAPSHEATLSEAFDREFALATVREARHVMAMRAASDAGAALRLRALEYMYEEGLPSREIASRLNVEVNAVYTLLTRARKDFREALMQVMAANHPDETLPELERRCVEVLGSL